MYRTLLLIATLGFTAAGAVAQGLPQPPLPDPPLPSVLAPPPTQPPVAEPATAADASAAIQATVEAYVNAFNQGDAATLASFWSEDSEFVAPSGQKFEGQQAIREGFAAFFQENAGAELEVDIAAIRLEATDAAVEEGTARLTIPEQPVSETTYVARYQKSADGWKLVGMRESEKAPSHYEQLKSLEWMIGEWGEQDDTSSVRTVCRWTKNKNFISRSFAVSFEGQSELEGTQVIGWDPDKQCVRSWLFDSDGGFAVGLWTQKENLWKITSLHVLSDGRKATAVNLITYVDENTFTWESTTREVDGEILPNIGPVRIERKASDN